MPDFDQLPSFSHKHQLDLSADTPQPDEQTKQGRPKGSRKKDLNDEANKKRRCISSACVPCRKRKSKCDGSTPACSACAAVYRTECRYDPSSDHRRKGVYKRDIDNLKTRNSTLQTLIQAILNYPEDEAHSLVRQIRTCESLDTVADSILARENGLEEEEEEEGEPASPDEYVEPTFESHLSGKMGDLLLEDGTRRYIGGTSVLLNVGMDSEFDNQFMAPALQDHYASGSPATSWTNITSDADLVTHLLNMYFTWHYTFFTTLSKSLFYRDFFLGKPHHSSTQQPEYCSPLLVNAMLALGCHFTSMPGARENKDDSATSGDHFFREAKRLLMEGDLHEKPRLSTVQALALMSVREAGCGREAKGWVYSGMSFRMACDLGLHLDSGSMPSSKQSEEAEDARRITFWGCFLFDKCWSNYLGRLPQLTRNIITVPKFDVFPTEDAETWSAYTDSGYSQAHAQPSRTRAVGRQISALCEISADLINNFYNPTDIDKSKNKQAELKKLSDIHQRLETWRRELPKELEPKEGGLPSMLVMHMFFQLLYIHLFRPFLKYNPSSSPLPAHVSPRKLCTQAAATISKLLRLYKRSHGLRQICNIAVYIAHSACTIHLLNLPDKIARRDIVHGVKHLEEIAEGWLCARRALGILNILAQKWKVDLPEDAATVLERADSKFGSYQGSHTTPTTSPRSLQGVNPAEPTQAPYAMTSISMHTVPNYYTINNSMGYTTAGVNPNTYADPYATTRALPPNTVANFAQIQQARQLLQASPRSGQHITLSNTAASSSLSTTANSTPPTTTGTTGGSPSEIFGDQQLVPRNEDQWYLRDQSQLASGFGNWDFGDSFGISNTGNHIGGVASAFGGGQQVFSQANVASGAGLAGVLGSLEGLNGLGNDNEADWYQ
ncbi:hypothetical protein EJ05DRAFT_488121 [Pseudovirgaria hyperparasitica]|uniref:Zn(2)-C6 fungal-type domain-containing protein n=1 Tax=Pseudovirgaria hyperparasitica TaxID=470096 RepID=A0A6A6W180_9PEZI|nr:uncharacterized protein EJ05DRAFT_488121 [Pseudovirgaria hyperparasitica]KAF2755337.1 hypothetical protein EJ05DRAFT_488121 [Pseudovirgaria hyperparasitica]